MSLRFFFSFVLIPLKSFKHLLHPETQEHWIFLSLIGWSWSTLGPFSWAHHLRYPCFSQETLKELTLLSGLSFASSSTLCLAFQTLCLKVDPVSLSLTPSSVPPSYIANTNSSKISPQLTVSVHWRTVILLRVCPPHPQRHTILYSSLYACQLASSSGVVPGGPRMLAYSSGEYRYPKSSASITQTFWVYLTSNHSCTYWKEWVTWWTAVREIFVQC